ncbi:MAG: hypothetical protein QW091_00340 [Candidatus Micrarchaeaceae archaeon]
MQALRRNNTIFDDLPRPEWASLIMEIGFDDIETATSFVEYYCERYGESKSSVWYRLKRLKKLGYLNFAEKGEEARSLALTKLGRELFRQSHSLASIKSLAHAQA